MIRKFLPENFRLTTEKLFEVLSPEEYELLVESGVTHVYKSGQIVFREGGIPTGIFYIKTGKIKKYKTTPKGGEQIFYICSEGELLGYHSLLGEEYYMDSAAAIVESDITFIPKESFVSILRNSSALSNALLKALGHEFSSFMNHMSNLTNRSVRERLAFNLLILDKKFKDRNQLNNTSVIRLSRGDLASMVGTAKETLVRLLHDFRQLGLIEKTDKTIWILDRKGLIKEAGLIG